MRALTRNPEGAKGQELKSKGCEVVKCDLDDKESVEKAIHGTDLSQCLDPNSPVNTTVDG